MLNWYLIYTKPKNEDVVTKKLLDKGFEVLNPKFNERRYTRGKIQHITSPLFPCYIFVRFDIFKYYRFIKYTRGIRRIIGTENMPAVVSEGIICSIRDRMAYGIVSITPKRFEPGEEVIIKAGPLQGLNAVFERELHSTERVSILLKTINARVDIDYTLLEKIG